LNSARVALFFAATSAPGMTAPDESTTTPESEDVTCPKAEKLSAATANEVATTNPMNFPFTISSSDVVKPPEAIRDVASARI
jgi:hypothetical protein